MFNNLGPDLVVTSKYLLNSTLSGVLFQFSFYCSEQIESCRSKQKDLDLNKAPKPGLSIEQINSVAHKTEISTASQVHAGNAASEVDATASEVGATISEVDASVDATTTAASDIKTTASDDATVSEVAAIIDAATATASDVDTTTSKDVTDSEVDATTSEVDATVNITTTTASEIDTASSEDATASVVDGTGDATATTESAVDATGSGVFVTATESDTQTIEVGTTASDVSDIVSEVINTTSESATHSSETGTVASAEDNTVSKVEATYLASPLPAVTQPSEYPSTVATSTTQMPTAGVGTANQEPLSDTFLEENYEPDMTADENNVESNIVPIVGETETIPDTATENIIENVIEELIGKHCSFVRYASYMFQELQCGSFCSYVLAICLISSRVCFDLTPNKYNCQRFILCFNLISQTL